MQQVKDGATTAMIGAVGAGISQAVANQVLATGIAVLTLFTVGVRAVIAMMDLRKRLREEKCSQNSSNPPPTA